MSPPPPPPPQWNQLSLVCGALSRHIGVFRDVPRMLHRCVSQHTVKQVTRCSGTLVLPRKLKSLTVFFFILLKKIPMEGIRMGGDGNKFLFSVK